MNTSSRVVSVGCGEETARSLRDFRVTAEEGRVPVPVAHLTVRSDKGIWLALSRR